MLNRALIPKKETHENHASSLLICMKVFFYSIMCFYGLLYVYVKFFSLFMCSHLHKCVILKYEFAYHPFSPS